MKPLHLVFSLSLALGIALAAAPVLAQQSDALRQAQQYHEQGVQLFLAGRFREATQAFEQSERLVSNPLNQWNLMRCYQELRDYRNALRWVERYLSTPDLSAADRAEAEQRRQQIVAARGRSPSSLVGPWVLLGSGLAVVVAGVVLFGVAYADYTRDPQEAFATIQTYREWREGYENLALAGDVLVGVGAAAAVGGLVWLLVARRSHGRPSAGRTPVLGLAAEPGGLFVRFGFEFPLARGR